MQQHYHMKLSDGDYVTLRADSAASAIGKALREYRGRTVIQCHSGGQGGGRITFEIPRHDPLPAKKLKTQRKVPGELFNIEQIETASLEAQRKASNE